MDKGAWWSLRDGGRRRADRPRWSNRSGGPKGNHGAGYAMKLMSQPFSTGSMVDCLTNANSMMDLAINSSLGMDAVNDSGWTLWLALSSGSGSVEGMEVISVSTPEPLFKSFIVPVCLVIVFQYSSI